MHGVTLIIKYFCCNFPLMYIAMYGYQAKSFLLYASIILDAFKDLLNYAQNYTGIIGLGLVTQYGKHI